MIIDIFLFSTALAKTKGASIFSFHQSTAPDEQPSAQLAVASRRKIILYHVSFFNKMKSYWLLLKSTIKLFPI